MSLESFFQKPKPRAESSYETSAKLARAENDAAYQYQADLRNGNRDKIEKILRKNKLRGVDLAHENALAFNNRFDQIVHEKGVTEAQSFVSHRKKMPTHELLERQEQILQSNEVLKEAFQTGDFIDYFKTEITPILSNPVSLRLLASRFCTAGMTSVTVDQFYAQQGLREFIEDGVMQELSKLGSLDAQKLVSSYIANKIFPEQTGRTLLEKLSAHSPTHNATDYQPIDDDALFKKATSYHGYTKVSLSETLPNVERRVFSGNEVPEALRTQLLKIYENSYSEERGYGAEFQSALLTSMSEALSSATGKFHLLFRDEKLLGFMYMGKSEPSTIGNLQVMKKHLGMFNVIPDFIGAKIGILFLKEVILEESDGSIIEASAEPGNPICTYYIEEAGFVGTKEKTLGGRKLLEIILFPELNKTLGSKKRKDLRGLTLHELVTKVREEELTINTASDVAHLDFSPLNNGFVLARIKPNEDGGVIGIFEKSTDFPV